MEARPFPDQGTMYLLVMPIRKDTYFFLGGALVYCAEAERAYEDTYYSGGRPRVWMYSVHDPPCDRTAQANKADEREVLRQEPLGGMRCIPRFVAKRFYRSVVGQAVWRPGYHGRRALTLLSCSRTHPPRTLVWEDSLRYLVRVALIS